MFENQFSYICANNPDAVHIQYQSVNHTHRRSLAPLILPRPPTALCQSVLVLWIQPHVFFPERHQHLPQRSLQSLRCNLLCFPFHSCPPWCHRPVFWSWGKPASVHFDCNQRSISGFLSHLDSLDWYIDSYLSWGSFRWGYVGVRDWWVYKTLDVPMWGFLYVFVSIQWSIMIQYDEMVWFLDWLTIMWRKIVTYTVCTCLVSMYMSFCWRLKHSSSHSSHTHCSIYHFKIEKH